MYNCNRNHRVYQNGQDEANRAIRDREKEYSNLAMKERDEFMYKIC